MTSFSVPFSRLPAVGMELARLMREVKIQETLLGLLMEQYERAKINEARDTPTVRVMDKAIPPVKKARPKRMMYLAGGLFLGFVMSVLFSFFMKYVEVMKARIQEYSAWKGLWGIVVADFQRKK